MRIFPTRVAATRRALQTEALESIHRVIAMCQHTCTYDDIHPGFIAKISFIPVEAAQV